MKKETTPLEFSNIVTPPDFVSTQAHTVIMIDPEWSEVEDIAFYLKTSKDSYNVYVYKSEMNDAAWLKKAMTKSTHIIVNTINNESSPLKDTLITHKKKGKNAWYYGPKNFLTNTNKIDKPIDYFVHLEK